MKTKLYILPLILLFPIILFSQEQVYFNNIYNPVNTYASGRGILQIDDNYYGIFGTLEPTGYWYNLGVFKLSSSGNLLDWSLVGENGYDYFAGSVGGTLINTIDGNLAFACQIGAPGLTIGTLVKLNLELDTIWQKVYQIEDQHTMTIKVIQTIDSGYVMVGQVYPGTGYYFDALVIKTDNSGSIQWYNTFGVGTNASEYGTDVIQTSNGGLLIGGMKDIEAIDHSLDAMLIKTDSLGNEEWTKYYGNPDVDDDMALLAMAGDGNYLVATVHGDSIMSSMYREGRIWIMKIDTLGNIIEENKYGPSTISNQIKNIRKLDNGYYISSGFKFSYDDDYFKGWMFKFSENMDSIWMRDYHYYDGFEETNFFYDASPTSDDGYIAIGKARPDGGGQTNKMWIVKVDSMGCDTPGCATGTFVHEFSPFGGGWGEDIKVWPNPVSDKLNVKSYELKVNGKRVIRVYNSQGLKVKEINVPDDIETLTVDVSGYNQGLYYLQYLLNGQPVGIAKIIKK